VVEPVHAGKHGHPVLIARTLWPELLAADPAIGAKEVIRRHRPAGAQVEWDDPSVLTDLDTPADFDAWVASRR
jgi:molybdenum cofactor cytidylyltransferase